MNKLLKFFGIADTIYKFEWIDLNAILTVLNVLFIIAGFWWAPFIGIVNCGVNIVLIIVRRGHINEWVMNIALIILNIYFLT